MSMQRRPRPKASTLDILHIASDVYHDQKKLGQLRELNKKTEDLANTMSAIAINESYERQAILRSSELTNDLLSGITRQNEILKKQQREFINVGKASLNELQTISSTLLSIKREEATDREQRMVLHQINLRMNELDKIKIEYPEWALLHVEALYEIITERRVSISDFSASFSDLDYAQSCFDRLTMLQDELTEMNGGSE